MHSSVDTPLNEKVECDLHKMLPLLRNLKLLEDTLIELNIYYDDITLSLTASENINTPILLYFHQVYPNNPIHYILFPLHWNHLLQKYYQIYLIMYIALYKSTLNSNHKATEKV